MTFFTHGSRFQWYRTYERGYTTSGSHLHIMLRRSSLVKCVSVLHGTCLQSVEKKIIQQYRAAIFVKNLKYTFYTTKSSLTLAYKITSQFKLTISKSSLLLWNIFLCHVVVCQRYFLYTILYYIE